MKKIFIITLATILGILMIFTSCSSETPAPGPAPASTPSPASQNLPTPSSGPVKDMSMVGATVGSGAFAINVGMTEIWNKYVEKPTKVNISVRPYTATVAIMKDLDSGEADVVWAPSAFPFQISKGIGPYREYGKRSFYTLFEGGIGTVFVFTTDPDVKTIADLKGKKFSGKQLGSPPIDQVRTALLEANGMTDDDIRLVEYTSYSDCVQQVKEGTTDIGLTISSQLNPTVEELFISKDTHFIPFSDDEIGFILEKMPYRFPCVVPAGYYKGQDKDAPTTCSGEGVYVRHDFDPDLAYEMVKVLYEHHDELEAVHITAKHWSIEEAATMTRIFHPFSPGSIKYFKEIGIWNDEKEAKQQQLLKEAGL